MRKITKKTINLEFGNFVGLQIERLPNSNYAISFIEGCNEKINSYNTRYMFEIGKISSKWAVLDWNVGYDDERFKSLKDLVNEVFEREISSHIHYDKNGLSYFR